ncbi:MAG TPA: FAD-dependent oxidoreductase [bacterium]|nr:FAD-dependent oxidoreductase [bacterium]HPL95573.1 FAD-dependent oxidoreductase [bacterium]
MSENIYDVIIVGAGPAGLTAGIYTTRRALKTLVVGAELGGQISKTVLIENYPGIKTTGGLGLAYQMQEQLKSFGAEIITDQATSLKLQDKIWQLTLSNGQNYFAKTIILAFGLKKRKLGLANEEKFDGRGLSYCVNCDGPLFKDKNVVVVGGGNSGADAVEFLAKICPQVYWLEVTDKFRADERTQEKIKQLKNVTLWPKTKLTNLAGTDFLASVTAEKDGQLQELNVSGVFVEIGYQAETSWLKELINLDELGQIKIDNLGHTNQAGIFAAGDVTNSKYKQIVVAEGAGAIAALEVYDYVQKNF